MARNRLPSPLAIDLRGLALLRIGLGTLLVVDLLNRLRSFGAHYGAHGVLPREVYYAEFETKWHISLYLFSSADAVAVALFALAIACALLLAVGYRTRVATIASWLLLISLHSRNPFVLQGGDEILRALVFWSMFLPLGARWSFDRALSEAHADQPEEPIVSMATLCFIGQILLLYAFATASKLIHPVWWREGLGVYYALGVEQFTTRAGLFLREQTWLLGILNYATLALQACAPALLLVGFARDWIRTLLPPVMIGLHLGFAITMELGLFSYIVAVTWLALLSPQVLDRLEKRVPNLGPWLRLKRDSLLPGSKPRPAPRIVSVANPAHKALLASLLVYLLWWNLANQTRDIFRVPRPLHAVAEVLRLEQRWEMFSNPPRWSEWFVVTGIDSSGDEIDLATRRAPRYEKPPLVSSTFPTQRWRKYLNNIATARGGPHRKHFAAFACREWNASNRDAPMEAVRVTILRQATPDNPTETRLPPDRVVLGTWRCDGSGRLR